MDQGTLVTNGHKFTELLTGDGINPRAVMWVHNPEVDIWRLWIVPSADLKDKREFYRRVADIISKHRSDLPGLDVSDIEFVKDTHPAIQALKSIVSVSTGGSIHMSNNIFNGFFLPDCIILQMSF